MNSTSRKHAACLAFFLLFIIITVLVGFHIVKVSRDHLTVKTKLGRINGVRADDGEYTMFKGIPYAKVNQSNPFGNAIPVKRHKGVMHANDATAICPQKDEYNNTIVGQLDCLHLNIYVPHTASATNKLPVLVYILGGRYVSGFAGQYGPKFLLKQNIILITFNYRLGAYGFLCLDTPEVPGNQGLKDQILALKWIKSNIEAFGGDSNRITLAGENSGGENVNFHLTFGDEGLFNNVIIGDGIITDGLDLVPSDKTVPLKLAADLGFKTENIDAALIFLTSLNTYSVVEASTKLKITYGPCVEKPFPNIKRFITNYKKIVDTPNVKNVSVMLSQSHNKMVYDMINKNLDNIENENVFKEFLEAIFDIDEDKIDSLVEQVRNFYIGDKEAGSTVKRAMTDFMSDIIYNYPIRKMIKYLIRYNATGIYHMIFSYEGERNLTKELMKVNKNGRNINADEIAYLFDVSYMRNPINTKDQLMIDRITTLWANFVKYGNPTPEHTALLPIIWEPTTEESLQYLNFDTKLTMGSKPFNERMQFWEWFYEQNNVSQRLVARPWTF